MSRRNFTRVDYSEGVSIRFDDHVVFGRIQNLSLCGMFIRTEQDVPLDRPVQLTVYHTASASFKLNAQAVRRNSSGFGFQVKQIDVRAFDALRNIVEEKCSDQSLVMGETYRMLSCITHAAMPV